MLMAAGDMSIILTKVGITSLSKLESVGVLSLQNRVIDLTSIHHAGKFTAETADRMRSLKNDICDFNINVCLKILERH